MVLVFYRGKIMEQVGGFQFGHFLEFWEPQVPRGGLNGVGFGLRVEFWEPFFGIMGALGFIFCRSTEQYHVKDNLHAKLLCIRSFGKMKLEEFKDLISFADYKICENKMDFRPTWDPLTIDIFVKFLYKVLVCVFLSFLSHFLARFSYCFFCFFQREISNAADTDVRIHHENNPEDRRSAPKIWDAMVKTQEKLVKSIRSRNFEKYISIAHKDYGDDFFQEVPLLPQLFQFQFHLSFHLFVFHIHFLPLCGRLTVITPPSSTQI